MWYWGEGVHVKKWREGEGVKDNIFLSDILFTYVLEYVLSLIVGSSDCATVAVNDCKPVSKATCVDQLGPFYYGSHQCKCAVGYEERGNGPYLCYPKSGWTYSLRNLEQETWISVWKIGTLNTLSYASL